jgi:hypothetical protein
VLKLLVVSLLQDSMWLSQGLVTQRACAVHRSRQPAPAAGPAAGYAAAPCSPRTMLAQLLVLLLLVLTCSLLLLLLLVVVLLQELLLKPAQSG